MKVLVIENNSETADWLKGILESMGFEVTLSSDGLDGLGRAKREKPDLVVLNLFVPSLDGYMVSAFLKRHRLLKETKILAVSSKTTSLMHQLLEEAGIDLFVQLEKRIQTEGKRTEFMEKLDLLMPQESVTN